MNFVIRRKFAAIAAVLIVLLSTVATGNVNAADAATADDQARIAAVAAVIDGAESYGRENFTSETAAFVIGGGGYNGEGKGWFSLEKKGKNSDYKQSIANFLDSGEHFANGIPRDPNYSPRNSTADLMVYTCGDRVAVFSDSDGIEPSAADVALLTDDCQRIPYLKGKTYFQMSAPIADLVVSVTPDTQRPSTPTGVSWTAADTSVEISWVASTDNVGVVEYIVYSDADGIEPNNSPESVLARTSSTSVTVDGLEPGSTSYFYVRARDAAGNVSWRTGYKTVNTTADVTAPSVPGSLSGSSTETSISLSWQASTDNVGVVEYRVTVDGQTSTVTGTSFTASGLTPGQSYPVSVRAVDAAGNVSAAASGSFSTSNIVDTQRPSTPTGVSWTAADTSVEISWVASTDNVGVVEYIVYSDADGVAPNDRPESVLARTSSTSVTVDGLEPGSTTHFYVRARDAAGNVSWRTAYKTVQTTAPCDPTKGTQEPGKWHTEEVCGVWQIINPAGEVDHWNAVNVRTDQQFIENNGVTGEHIALLKEHFDVVRLSLHWDEMQPDGPTELSSAWVDEVKTMLQQFDDNDIDVVLDIVHLGGKPKDTGFQIPDWAWDTRQTAVLREDRDYQHTYEAWAGADDKGLNVQKYINLLAEAGILTHRAVIAVEIVNEPHPPARDGGGRGGAAQSEEQERLAKVYNELIGHIRTKDADMMVVLGAYHGGTRHGGLMTNGEFEYNHAKTEITHTNTVWTAHNYFTGFGDIDDDRNDGQKDNGALRVGAWAEGPDSAGCYGGSQFSDAQTTTGWNCPAAPANRSALIDGHKANAKGHWQYAQDAAMPFFMGEWGVGRQRLQSNRYIGWGLSDYFACDKMAAYEDVDDNGNAISWAVWSFDANTDAFGLFYARALDKPEAAQSHREYLTLGDWANSGLFGSLSEDWAGDSWVYAEPFTNDSYCDGL